MSHSDLLNTLNIKREDSLKARPHHNEIVKGVIELDTDHISVMFLRNRGSESEFGIRTINLVRTVVGYGSDAKSVWVIESEEWFGTPLPITTRRGGGFAPIYGAATGRGHRRPTTTTDAR